MLPGPVAEKIDIRKYWLILWRRKWWGLVPFITLLIVFAILYAAVPPKYMASCVVKASRSEVAEIYSSRLGDTNATRTSIAIVNEEMLRYDRVMAALTGTNLLGDIERRSERDPALRGKLEEELYKRITKHTTIGQMGTVLISINYLGSTPDESFTVLQRLVNHFVENALAKERDDARRARDMALTEVTQTKDELESLENRLVTFNEDHPGTVGSTEGGSREALNKVDKDIEDLEREVSSRRKKLERYVEQLEDMPQQVVEEVTTTQRPDVVNYRNRLADMRAQLAMALKSYTPVHPTVKMLQAQIEATEEELARVEEQSSENEVKLTSNMVRQQLEDKKLELEADLDYQTELRRALQLRRTRLQEEVTAMPGLQRELGRLVRERESAGTRYDSALKNFRRIDQDFTIKMEGLVSFSVVSPPRIPQNKDMTGKTKLALMGVFVATAAAVAAIAGTEFLDQSFTDVELARDFLRLPSLGIIPMIETANDKRRRWRKVLTIAGIVIAALVASALIIMFVPPINRAVGHLWQLLKDWAVTIG